MPAQAHRHSGRRSEATKVDGTDNVYIWRNGNHQSMFIVTKDGVIATDPVAYGRPTGGQQYVDEIKKVTDKPIKYLIYSHLHFDHIAGGKAFKDAGARVIAHKNATARLKTLKDPHTVIAGRVGRQQEGHQARRHHARAALSRPQPLRLDAGDAAAEGEDHLHRRHHSGRRVPGPRLHRHLSAGDRGLHQEGDRDGLGAHDPGPSRTRRPARHQAGRAGRPDPDAGGLRPDQEGGSGGQVLGRRREGLQDGEVRHPARLRQRPRHGRAALLRTCGAAAPDASTRQPTRDRAAREGGPDRFRWTPSGLERSSTRHW